MLRFALLLCLLALQACASSGTPRVIYLARHGQTGYNRVGRFQGDPDLDAVGYVNRVSLWHLLRERPIAAIYTSERLRTKRTADLVARQHGLPLQPRPALNEIYGGVLEGICFSLMAPEKARPSDRECEVRSRGARVEQTLPVIQQAYRAAGPDKLEGKFPLAESVGDVARRVGGFVEELRRGFVEREVLVVGHGVVNRVVLHHLMGWPLASVVSLRQENDQVFRLETDGEKVVRLSLYSPGQGWRECQSTPTAETKRLDCHPPERDHHLPPPTPPPASRPR